LLSCATGSYDDAGELTSSTLSGAATSYSYNGDGERMSATQGSTTTDSASWNAAGTLGSYSDTAGRMAAATYNGDGLRQSSTITPADGSAESSEYVWSPVGSLPQMIMDGTNAYIYGEEAAPVEQVNVSSGAVTYLLADSLGSVRGTVSSTGSLTGTAAYDAWGYPETAVGLTGATPFGYAGGYTDADGMIYLRAPYYDKGWDVDFFTAGFRVRDRRRRYEAAFDN
jgi:YD repeat-containing protein